VDAALERIQSGDGHEVSDEALSTIVAHDLRNPLQVATARLEMVRQDCDHEQLSTIARSLSRMDQLIDNLLMSSAEDHLTTELDDVNLSSTVQTSWQNVPHRTRPSRTRLTGLSGRIKNCSSNCWRTCSGTRSNTSEISVTVTVGTLESGFYLEDDGQGIPSENGQRCSTSVSRQPLVDPDWDSRSQTRLSTVTDGTWRSQTVLAVGHDSRSVA